jgi:ferredoxin
MSIRVHVDAATCQAYGNCVLLAEDIFSVGDDSRAVVLQDVVEEDRLGAIQAAVYDCPTGAISFERLSGDAGSR